MNKHPERKATYLRLKAEGLADKAIAERLSIKSGTLQQWKQRHLPELVTPNKKRVVETVNGVGARQRRRRYTVKIPPVPKRLPESVWSMVQRYLHLAWRFPEGDARDVALDRLITAAWRWHYAGMEGDPAAYLNTSSRYAKQIAWHNRQRDPLTARPIVMGDNFEATNDGELVFKN